MSRRYPVAWRYSRFSRLRETVLVVTIVALATFLVASHLNRDKYQIPKEVSKQLNFPVLFLKNPSSNISLKMDSVKITQQDKDTKVFSFIINEGTTNLTFTEQAYPEALIYDKLANSINPYSEIGSSYGKATLGRPKDGGAQVAVLKYSDSTLIFAKPSGDLSDSDWQKAFNSLEVAK